MRRDRVSYRIGALHLALDATPHTPLRQLSSEP